MFAISSRPRLSTEDYKLLNLADELTKPFNVFDPRELMLLKSLPSLAAISRESEVQNTDKEFRIRLDLQHFKPEEVKIVSDNQQITISAKHEEMEDKHGYVARSLTRVYKLPEDVDAKSVTSTMSPQGVLSINVAKKEPEPQKDFVIPVEFKN